MTKYLKKVSLLSAIMFFLGGCATLEGMGKDLEKAGEKIQEAVEDKSE